MRTDWIRPTRKCLSSLVGMWVNITRDIHTDIYYLELYDYVLTKEGL